MLQTNEVMQLTTETLKMAKIAQIDYATATDYMTVAIRGFHMEMSEAQHVTDVYSHIAAISASDTEELAVAMSKTASSAAAVGSSFENTTAMIALMVETTREAPENIGSALKSIISRYGELKTSPTTLVDAEGEALSFNKVDTALQSVGITMKTTSGQFRDFDDVILDLSKKWQTLDKNTQRYIATVMAGNRQQSRFIALVDNYSRLSELTEEAANAQDAGTLQYLKTLDSIESKLNQVQVAFQQFYTSMGLETIFKGALDTATAFINTLNSLPKIFDKIPAAALSMGASLIIAVKHIIKLLAVPLYTELKKLKKQIGDVTGANYQIHINVDGKTTEEEARKAARNAQIAAQEELDKKQVKLSFGEKFKQNSTLIKQVAGSAITAAGNIWAATALTKENTSGANVETGKVQSGIIGTLSNVVGGALTGNWLGALAGVVKSVGYIATLFDGLDYDINERRKAYEKEIQELENESIKKNNEVKTIDQTIKKLEELAKVRWASNEANQEYLDYIEKIKESNPELLSSFDLEKNAILDSTKAYEALTKAKQEAAEVDVKLAEKNYQLANLELEYITQNTELTSLFTKAFNEYSQTEANWTELKESVKSNQTIDPNQVSFITANENLISFYRKYKKNPNAEGVQSVLNQTDASGQNVLGQTLFDLIKQNDNFHFSDIFSKVINPEDESKYSTFSGLKSDIQDYYGAENSIILMLEYVTKNAAEFAEELEHMGDDLAKKNIALNNINNINNFELNTPISNRQRLAFIGSDNLTNFVANNIKNTDDYKNSKKQNLSEYYLANRKLFEETTTQYTQELLNFYSTLDSESKELFLSELGNATHYSSAASYINALGIEDTTSELYKSLVINWNAIVSDVYEEANDIIKELPDEYQKRYKSIIKWDPNNNKADISADFLAQLNNGMQAVNDFYNQGMKATANARFTAIEQLWTSVAGKEDLQQLIAGVDLTSQDELFKLRATLQDEEEENSETISAITYLLNTFVINSNTVVENFLSSLKSGTETADKFFKNLSAGFDYADLFEELTKLQLVDPNLTLNDVFEYNATLKKYIYTINGVNAAYDNAFKNITTEYNQQIEHAEELKKQIQEVRLKEDDTEWRTTYATLLEGYGSLDNAEKEYEKLINNLDNAYQFQLTNYFNHLLNSIDYSNEQIFELFGTTIEQYALALGKDIDVKQLLDTFKEGGEKAVELYSELIGDAFDSETATTLYQGQSGVRARIVAVNKVIELKVGDIIDANTAKLAGLLDEDSQASYVLINSAEQLIDVANNLYTELAKKYAKSAIQLNDLLDARDQALEQNIKDARAIESTISGANNLNTSTIREFEDALKIQILDNMGNVLDEYSNYITRTGLESWAVTDFSLFDNLQQANVDSSYQKYLEEARFIAEKSLGESIVNLAKTISESSKGEKINVRFLPKTIQDALGATNGVLEIAEKSQAELINNLMEASMNALATLPQGMAQVADILTEYYNAIISLTEGGIGGTLSEVDKQKLIDAANGQGLQLTDDDFTKTLKGYKLTTDAALKLQVITKGTTYSTLIESLIETDDKYKTIQDTLRTQKQLEAQLAEARAKQDDAEIQALDKQLQLTKDIVQTQSLKNTSSYDFMNRNNEFFGAPTNYFSSIDTALDKWKEFQQGKLLDPQDLENILIELNNIVARGGQNLKIARVELDGGSEAVTNAFAAMMKGLTISSDGIGVSLTKLGANFDFGIDDLTTAFEDGIKTLAEENIKMLDSIISMLEMVQALENIDASGNPQEFLESVFGLYQNMPDAAKEIFDETQLTLKTGTKSIKEWIDEFSTGNYDEEDLTLFANFFTQLQQIPEDFDWSSMTLGQFTSWLQGVADGCNNVATAAEDATDQIKELAKAGDSVLTPDEEKQLADNKEQSDIKFSPNTILKAKQARQKRDGVVANPYNGPGSEFDIIGSDFSGPKEEEKEKETPPVVTEVTIQYSPDTPAGLKRLVECLDSDLPLSKIVNLFLSSPELEDTDSPYIALLDNPELLRQIILAASTSNDEETQKTFAELSQEEWFQKLFISAFSSADEETQGILNNLSQEEWFQKLLISAASSNDQETQQLLADLMQEQWFQDLLITAGLTNDKIKGLTYDTATGSWYIETIDGTRIDLGNASLQGLQALGLNNNWNLIDPITGEEIDISTVSITGLTHDENGWHLSSDVNGNTLTLDFNPEGVTGLSYTTGENGGWSVGTVIGDFQLNGTSQEEINAAFPNNPLLYLVPAIDDTQTQGVFTWHQENKTITFDGQVNGKELHVSAGWDPEQDNPQDLLNEFADQGITFTVTAPTADAQTELNEFIKDNDGKTITIKVKELEENNGWTPKSQKEEYTQTNLPVVGTTLHAAVDRSWMYGGQWGQLTERLFDDSSEKYKAVQDLYDLYDSVKAGDNLNQEERNFLEEYKNSIKGNGNIDNWFGTRAQETIDYILKLDELLNSNIHTNNATTDGSEHDLTGLDDLSKQTADLSDTTQDASGDIEDASSIIVESSEAITTANQNEANSANNASANINRLSNNSNTVTRGFDILRAASQNTQNEFNHMNTVLPRVIEKLEIIANTNPNGESGGVTGKLLNPGRAKGNVALAQGTLMGELGPELFVTGGHYYIAGQSGAEFVNLPDDAIVFNHLQTARLMGSGHTGRGKAVTNEHKATSMATGTPKGEAKASVSDTLSKLYDLRAMWQAILDLGSQDLGKLAGGSGGGGGKEQAAINKEIERWYNLLRQIANLEKQITLEQQKRNNLVHGGEIYNSYRKESDMLEAELKRQKELNALQKDWYDRKREDLATSEIGKYIFTYDENGLMQYRDGRNLGLDILENLTRVDANENAVDEMDTAKKQLQYLESIGFDISTLAGDDEGAKVQDFFSKIDAQMKEMDSLWDEFVDGQNSVEKLVEKQNNILETIQKNQIDLENKILDSIVERQQQMIDAAQAERDAISDSNQRFLNGLSEQLSKERELYDRNEDDEELRKLQRQLAILQRSGGSSSQIRSLQEQITNRQQERYFQAQQDQIDAVQEASDLEIDRLDRQINLMTETLEYQKENGLFWGEVTELLSTSPENIAQFIATYNPDFAANSATANAVEFADLIKMAQMYVADREETGRKANETSAWESYSGGLSSKYFASGGLLDTNNPMGKRHLDSLEERYRAAYLEESGKYEDFNTNAEAQRLAAQAGASAAEAYLKALTDDANRSATASKNANTTSSGSSGSSSISSGGSSKNQEEITQLKSELSAKEKESRSLSGILAGIKDNINYWTVEKEKYDNKLIQAEFDNDFKAAADAEKNVEITRKKLLEQRDLYAKYNSKRNSVEFEIDDIKGRLRELNVPGYKKGGIINYTGPAIVHGSKQHPEGVLSAEAFEQLRNMMLTSIDLNSSIADLQNGLNRSVNNIRNVNNTNSSDSVSIDNLVLQITSGTISNDYDARRAADIVMDEIMKIANKSGVRSVSRR